MRALSEGRFNLSLEDINTLAYPVLRHRIKPSFNAVSERLSNDDLITGLIKEVSGKKAQSKDKDKK